MLADRLDVAEVVVLLDEAVEDRLLRAAAHLAEFEGADRSEARLDRRSVDGDEGRSSTVDERVAPDPARGWKLDEPGAVELEQQTAGDHGARSAVGLHPVPGAAELGGEVPAAGGGVLGDEGPDRGEV